MLVERFVVQAQESDNVLRLVRALRQEFKANDFYFRKNSATPPSGGAGFTRVKSIQSDLIDWIHDRLWFGHFIAAHKAMVYLVKTYNPQSGRFSKMRNIFINFAKDNIVD